MYKKFPEDFLWGAATSAHQVEGGTHNNWSEWERQNAERLAKEAHHKWEKWQQAKFPEMFEPKNYISGRACDHYHRYREDFDLAKAGGHNAHRFSLEWSRIEPEEGKFDEREIEHYRQVILALKERGLEPFVTLWHWTNPLWLEKIGGLENKKFTKYFARFAKVMAEGLGDDVKFWVTINEPTSVIAASYTIGLWPPQKRNIFLAWRLFRKFSKIHIAGYRAIHKVSKNSQVGFANVLQSFEAYNERSFLDRLMKRIGIYVSNKRLLKMTLGYNDFLTVQYYFHNRFKFPKKIRMGDKPVSDLNWEIYPPGIYFILRWLKKYQLPIYITENGLADADDSRREEFIQSHLLWIQKAMAEGADVRGYFHWSLLDNFEWDKGFWPRFGLVEIDYKTLERRPRQSFYVYKQLIENKGIE